MLQCLNVHIKSKEKSRAKKTLRSWIQMKQQLWQTGSFYTTLTAPPDGLLCALNVALDNSSAVVPLKSTHVGNVKMEREKRDGRNNKVGVKTGCTICCVSLYLTAVTVLFTTAALSCIHNFLFSFIKAQTKRSWKAFIILYILHFKRPSVYDFVISNGKKANNLNVKFCFLKIMKPWADLCPGLL